MESTVLAVRKETPDTVTLRLAAPFHHVPGQFMMVGALLNGKEVRRSYSVASPANGEWAEITIKAQQHGVFSLYAQTVQPGSPLNVYGPFGTHFTFDPSTADPTHPVVFIAGGSGISPFRTMLLSAAAARYRGKIVLLYSVRTQADIIYEAELRALATQLSLELIITLTRPNDEELQSWKGQFGRINGKLLRTVLGDELLISRFYICGPTPMVQDAQVLLQASGVPKEHVRTEKFGAIEG
jgi:ferredoxin-NADP reductase